MRRTKPVRLRALALIGVATFAVAACGSSTKSTTSSTAAPGGGGGGAGPALKIGFFGALTGDNAQLGINIKNGEQLAVDQYNKTNPKNAVSIDPFDSVGDPAQAPTGASKMVTDKVVAVIGPAFSGESEAANPILNSAGIPLVTASATKVDLATKGWKVFHRALASDGVQGPADANYLANTLNAKSVAVIDDGSSYGQGLGDAVRTQLKTDGATDAVDDHIDPKGQDYGATVNKITAAKPAAVFFGGYYDGAGRLIKQLKDAGYSGAFMSGDGSEDAKFVTNAGGAPAEGAYLSCPCADSTKDPNAQAFVSAYQAAFSTAPAIYSAEAYDATNFVLAAIKSGAITTTAINDYLGANSYKGITKTLKFGANGNISGGTIYVYQVKSGVITQIGTTT